MARRHAFLLAAFVVPFAFGTTRAVATAPEPAASPAATAAREIAAGIHLVPGSFVPGHQPDGNSLLLVGPRGIVVVDSGRHDAHTERVLAAARALGAPIVAVVNTHWHLDHISGNARLRQAFPDLRVLASGALDAASKGFLASSRRQLEQMIASAPDAATAAPWKAELARIASIPKLAPDEVVTASGERTLAGRTLRLVLETPAVTAGDLWVFDPATRVLIAGDLVTLPVPFLDTACPKGWRSALDHLATIDFQLLVPGHGPPMSRAVFETYRTAFGRLLDCAASTQPVESCATGWLHDAETLLDGADPSFTRELLNDYLGEVLRGDRSRLEALCKA